MQKIIDNIDKINDWINKAPDINKFKDNDEFMEFSMELMNYTHYLLKIGVALTSSKEESKLGFSRNKAIIVGHMVRIVKLFNGLCTHVSKRESELAGIFVRLIYETEVKINYLLKCKKESFDNFILISHRSNKKILKDFKKIEEKRELIPIENRLKESIIRNLENDGISIEKLLSHKNWKLDGKSFEDILKHLDRDSEYCFMFGPTSSFIHGDWFNLHQYHLEKKDNLYFPDLDYHDPTPMTSCPLSAFCLRVLIKYLEWMKSDPDKFVINSINSLISLAVKIDSIHEKKIVDNQIS
ncbi:MAG: DUF5677 domain-containing protein [Thermodesulfobacteriota bacterium]